jgi:hypothetical protein
MSATTAPGGGLFRAGAAGCALCKRLDQRRHRRAVDRSGNPHPAAGCELTRPRRFGPARSLVKEERLLPDRV